MGLQFEKLYPDLAAAGGLCLALEQLAEVRGVRLTMHAESDRTSAVVISDRGSCYVNIGSDERVFILEFHEGAFTWASGGTSDLGAVISVLAAWLNGISAKGLASAFHFMSPGLLADARDDAEIVSRMWRSLLTDEVFIEERPLVEAVFANERFRNFFPGLSHGTLRLSMDLGRRGGREVHLVPMRAGGYRIEDTHRNVSMTEPSLEGAIHVMAAFLDSWEGRG